MVKAYGGILLLADVLLLILKMLYYIFESIYRLFVSIEEKSVAGEIVLITGAGHGIGRQLAFKYASLGATVVCWDLDQQSNTETVNEIKKLSGSIAYGYKCDVASREDVFKTAERVKQEIGHVTILVNNAGIMPCHAFLDYKPEEVKRLFDINVLAHFWTLQAFLPNMIENNHGHIVALSSMAGFLGLPNLAPYCATKFAVRGLMESLFEELRCMNNQKTLNVNFTVIYPYMVNTGLCKKPRIRFPSLMRMVPVQEAATEIVKAQRKNLLHLSIPGHWLAVNNVLRCFPLRSTLALVDFLDSGVDPDS